MTAMRMPANWLRPGHLDGWRAVISACRRKAIP